MPPALFGALMLAIAAPLFRPLASPADLAQADQPFVSFHEEVLGTSLELRLWGTEPHAYPRVEGAVLAEIARLSRIFSTHDPASELMRWQATRDVPVAVSPELYEVLALADAVRARTSGVFEPRIAALTRVWKSAAAAGRLPDPDDLAQVTGRFGAAAWALDPAQRTATRLTELPITLDAIAKGFIVERACAIAVGSDATISGVLLNLGGDLRAQGAGERCPVALAASGTASETAPSAGWIRVRDRSVATSNGVHRGVRIGDRWYSHVIDPRTGRPAERVASATVVAGSGALADALATAFNLLDPAGSLRVAASFPGVECRITTGAGEVVESPGWGALEAEPPAAEVAAPAPRAQGAPFWGETHELALGFTINRGASTQGPYRRPYVVVWVENEKGDPVRTLILWVSLGGSGPMQWLPDLKRWYQSGDEAAQVRHKNMVYTSARSTRPPGQYEVTWDGKDDAGQPVPPGKYTVYLEAAREHGTYQTIRHALAVPVPDAFRKEFDGGEEIKAAALEYRLRKPTSK